MRQVRSGIFAAPDCFSSIWGLTTGAFCAIITKKERRYSLMAKLQLPKLVMRVRFPLPAPDIMGGGLDPPPMMFGPNGLRNRTTGFRLGEIRGPALVRALYTPNPLRRRLLPSRYMLFSPSPSAAGKILLTQSGASGAIKTSLPIIVRAEKGRSPLLSNT